MAAKPVPDGYHTVTPYIVANDAGALIEFLQRAFGMRVDHRMNDPDARVWHADLTIGDSHIMVGHAAGANKPFPAMIYLYVPDCDAVYRRALAAGASSIMEPADQFYGDRHGGLNDPFGNQWWVATHIEDVPEAELQRRGNAFAEQRAARSS